MEEKKMASDLLLGWVLGLITVIMPQLVLEIYKLRAKIRFLTGPKKDEIPVKKKKGWFDWMRDTKQ